jgi:hypothetical protein
MRQSSVRFGETGSVKERKAYKHHFRVSDNICFPSQCPDTVSRESSTSCYTAFIGVRDE